jgi:glycosyltransferase involved in cell wall biosynthesis
MTPWGAESDVDSQALFGRTILQVVPALDASASACVEIAASLADAGARALVAGEDGRLASELQARGGIFIQFEAARHNPWQAWLNRRRLARLALREGVELIHAHSGAGAGAALFAARRARIPLVADYEAWSSSALEADSIVFFSRQELDEAVARRPALAAKAFRCLRGVDLRQFSAEAVDFSRVRRLRDALNVRAHERLAVAMGLKPERRQMFLAAAAQLKAKGFFDNEAQQARFVWLRREGEAPSGAFDAEASRLGLGDVVFQIDWADRAAACLAAAVVIAPANEAELCVEAQALGAPVIVLLSSGAPAEVETICAPPQVEAALRTGWLTPAGPPSGLARAVEEAMRLGATARDNLARNARAHACYFSSERVNAMTLAIYARHFGAGD